MWLTCFIAAAFFVAFIAAEYFGMKEREDEAERELTAHADGAAQPRNMLLDTPHGRAVTSDEVVHELEHRIDEERRDISYAMSAPERYSRIFEL